MGLKQVFGGLDDPVQGLDRVDLLLQRDIPRQFVPPVEDLLDAGRLFGTLLRIDLDDPDLVRFFRARHVSDKLPNRRILREQTIPVEAVVDIDRLKQVGECRGSENRLGTDRLFARIEGFELSAADLHRTDQQPRSFCPLG